MQTRTFRSRSLDGCFKQIKTEMGTEAVIVESHRSQAKLFAALGFGEYEVTATLDENTIKKIRLGQQTNRENPEAR